MKTIGQVCHSLLELNGIPRRVEVIDKWTDNCPFSAGMVLCLDPARGAWIAENGPKDILVLPFIIRRCFGVFFKEA